MHSGWNPSPEAVFDAVIPEYLYGVLYGAVVESYCSPGGLLPFQPLLRHLAGQLLHQFIIGWFSIAHSL